MGEDWIKSDQDPLDNFPQVISSISNVEDLLVGLDGSNICEGNSDEKYTLSRNLGKVFSGMALVQCSIYFFYW